MHPLVKEKQAEIILACQEYGIRKPEVFGSAARSTDFDPDKSDADFLVEFILEKEEDPLKDFFSFHRRLIHILNRKVDLIEDGSTRTKLHLNIWRL
ncbi:MAG: nucleotidyltransferase domain-containing protein [Thermostichus sp. BF3_bins_97]